MTPSKPPPATTAITRTGDDRIERTHAWLTRKKGAIEADLSVHAAEIGERLIETFFDGDTGLACSHNPHKERSLRALCAHPRAPFSLSALRTFIQVAQNFRLIPHDQAARLPPSHHALLYRVANPEERAALARQCAKDGTSARQLRELVKGRGRRRPGGGRRPDAPSVKELRAIRARIRRVQGRLDAGTVPEAGVDDLIVEARELRNQVSKLLDQLQDCRTAPR